MDMRQKAEDLARFAIGSVAGFPEAHRAALGACLLSLVTDLVSAAIDSDRGSPHDKTLRDAGNRLETLGCMVRLAREAGAIPGDVHDRWAERIAALGELTAADPPARFAFEELGSLDDRSMQRLLREVDSRELALALKGAPDAVKARVFRNMSQRMARMIRDELDYMGAVRERDVAETQRKIAATLSALEERGEIVVARAGERLVT